MSIDIDNLEALARAATDGPWSMSKDGSPVINAGGRAAHLIGPPGSGEEAAANTQFIVAADPATILAMIARLREAEEELAHTQGQRDAAILRAQRAEDGEQALAAHVERLRGVAENMDHFNDDEDLAEAEVALSDADDTLDEVFAQRDARVAADTYRAFRQEFDCYKGDGEKVGVATVRFMLDRWEQKMRRQAEQADTAKESS